MQTRRHSRRLNASAGPPDTEAATSAIAPSEPDTSDQTLLLELPDDLDLNELQSLVPSQPLLNPGSGAILDVYRVLLQQASQIELLAQERDASRADASRLEVELDQALQDQDVQMSQLRETLDEVQKELAQVKSQKQELDASRNSLQQQLANLTTTHSSSSTESEDLRRQITTIQAEKRDLLSVVDTLRDEVSQREEDSKALRVTLKEQRTEVGGLQTQLAESRSNEVSNKFRLQSLEQEIELVRSESQRNSAELVNVQETSSNDRRAKHAEIVRLQAEVDSISQDKAAAESRVEALRKANQAQDSQLKEALSRVSNLQAELAQQTTSFRAESETRKRLQELMDRRNEESKRRLEEIEQEWDNVVSKAAETEAQLREELNKERQRSDDLESRLEELRMVTDAVRAPDFGTPGGARASTPIPGTPGTPGSTSFFLSPAANLAIKLQKSGRSYTEIYADYVKTSEALVSQKEETRRLESALAQILTDIEERAPLIRSQQLEYSRLQEDASLLASQLADASSERDTFKTNAREAKAAARKAEEENIIFQKQLSDLGRQVQGLLREISVRDDASLEHMDFEDAPIVEDNDSEEVISNHLVLFRNLPQLQAQNLRLIKTARGLARQLEAKESDIESRLRGEESAALTEASEAVRDMEAELQRQKVLVNAHAKERDMYRNMLSRQSAGDLLGNGTSHAGSAGIIPTDSGSAQMLHEQQALFETFKTEIGVDTQKLKNDLAAAQRERDQNIVAYSKANAQVEYLQERIRLSQTTADLQTQELSNLQKRNQSLQDSLSKSEISSYHTSEELREARILTERLRQESANMHAENTFLKTVEARLQEDNRSILKERAQLQDLVSNLTVIHAELEKSGDGEKRRLERQVKTLETQTQDLRDQVLRDTEAARHTLLQKDAEIRELRGRLDALTEDLHKSREAQSVAEITKVHIERRSEDLERQLDSVKEKLAVYERLPSGATTSSAPSNGVSEETLLRAEVAELRAALKAAESDLAKSRQHVEQFKSISQANESALESLNTTYEQYKLDTEKELRVKGNELAAKTERLDVLQQDLASAHREQMDLAQQLETARTEFENDKRMLEATIADLSTVEDRALSTQASVQEDLRRQAQVAQDAHDKYTRELVAHAEAAKENTRLKEELLQVQAKARESESAAQVAIAKAAGSESNWASQRDALKKELEDVSARCMDLVSQNATLHQHLENVSSQAAKIRQTAEAPKTDGSATEVGEADSDDASAELRGVIAFVRREKEIAELQLDLHKQENVRLKAYSDRLNQSLEDTRKLLTEERERASRSVVSAEQHADLLEKIQQVNLLRESNATLRLDSEANLKAAQDLQNQLRAAHQELDPIKERVRILQAEVETRQGLIHRLEEDNRRLKDRTEQILSKHHRIDPEELQTLKDQLDAITKERDEKSNEAEKMRSAAATNKAAHEKLLSETRLQFGRINAEISQARSERDALRNQLEQSSTQQTVSQTASNAQHSKLQAELSSTQAALAQARQEAADAKQLAGSGASSEQLTSIQSELQSLRAEKQRVDEQLAAAQAQLQTEKTSLESQLERLKKRDDRLLEDNKKFIREKRALEAKVKELEETSQAQQTAQREAEDAAQPADVQELVAKRIAEITAEHEAQKATAVDEAVAKARQEAETTTKSLIPSSQLDEINARHKAELQALEVRLNEQHEAELKTAVEAASASVAKQAATIADSADGSGATVEGVTESPPSPAAIEAIVEDRLANAKALWDSENAMLITGMRAKVEEELAEKHRDAVNTAKENVAKELQMKMQLKDNMLTKARRELVEAKEKIESLTNGGSAVPQTGAAARVAAAANAANTANANAAAATGGASSSAPIPPKPVGVGRGTGLVTRGAAGRGRGTRGTGTTGGVALGRGGSQILQAVASQTGGAGMSSPVKATPTAPGQTSILGAAGAKRPRESDADTLAAGADTGAGTPKRARGGGPSIVRPTRGTPGTPKPDQS